MRIYKHGIFFTFFIVVIAAKRIQNEFMEQPHMLGCMYDPTLCPSNSKCAIDGVFGVCHIPESSRVRFIYLTTEQRHESKWIVQRLKMLGHGLSLNYSQCILKTAKYAYQRGRFGMFLKLDQCDHLYEKTEVTDDIQNRQLEAELEDIVQKPRSNVVQSVGSSMNFRTSTASITFPIMNEPSRHSVSDESGLTGQERVIIVVLVAVGGVVIAAVLVTTFFCYKCRRHKHSHQDDVVDKASWIGQIWRPPVMKTVKRPSVGFEEPVSLFMDSKTVISVLAYFDDHSKDKGRLIEIEWNSLQLYQPDMTSVTAALDPTNVGKNITSNPEMLPYDHCRIRLNSSHSFDRSDYINASPIVDHDLCSPVYIVTQHPLPHTTSDFWQMVWEQNCSLIVNLTTPAENFINYWPSVNSEAIIHHMFQVKALSERTWCSDYKVRNFILTNKLSNEQRVVTQFHLVTWAEDSLPFSLDTFLDFRRKSNKSFHGRCSPIVIHCSDGIGRSGTYCLIDMVLSRMATGAKEIDLSAAVEHLRDQRPQMILRMEQYEFAYAAVAYELRGSLVR